MPPAIGMHINTSGRRASAPENRVRASASKDRCRATWKSREKQKSGSHHGADRMATNVLSSRIAASVPIKPRHRRYGANIQQLAKHVAGTAADRLHYYSRPSALAAPFACHQADARFVLRPMAVPCRHQSRAKGARRHFLSGQGVSVLRLP